MMVECGAMDYESDRKIEKLENYRRALSKVFFSLPSLTLLAIGSSLKVWLEKVEKQTQNVKIKQQKE